MKLLTIRKLISSPLLVMCLGFLLTPRANASPSPFQIVCTVSGTTCGAGSVTLTTVNNPPTFNIVFQGNSGQSTGEAFLAVLVPQASASATWSLTVNGTTISAEESVQFTTGALGDSTVLNEPGMVGFNLSNFQSATSQNPTTASYSGGYTVFEYNLGSFTGSNGTGSCNGGATCTVSFTSALPPGTVIAIWLESGSGGSVVQQGPMSEQLTIVTPEPASLALFGSGLVLVGGYLRRRYFH